MAPTAEKDSKLVVTAAAQAQKAADFIVGKFQSEASEGTDRTDGIYILPKFMTTRAQAAVRATETTAENTPAHRQTKPLAYRLAM